MRAGILASVGMIAALAIASCAPLPIARGDGSVWDARYAYHGPCEGGEFLITNRAFYDEQIGIVVADPERAWLDPPARLAPRAMTNSGDSGE